VSASGFLLIKRCCESRGRGMKELGRSSAGAGTAGGSLQDLPARRGRTGARVACRLVDRGRCGRQGCWELGVGSEQSELSRWASVRSHHTGRPPRGPMHWHWRPDLPLQTQQTRLGPPERLPAPVPRSLLPNQRAHRCWRNQLGERGCSRTLLSPGSPWRRPALPADPFLPSPAQGGFLL